MKRFDLEFADPYGFREGMVLNESEDGDYVLFADVEKEIERLREAESILKELLETVKQTPLKSFADLLSDEWINIIQQTEKFLDNG